MRPARPESRSRRRRLIPRVAAVLVVAAFASLLFAPGAFANFITPKSGGSPNADSIATLYKIILYLAIVVFVVVEGALVYSIYKFRAKKSRVAAQIHGNTRLEIGWTVAAAVILVVITVVTFVKLPSIINPPNTSANGLLSATLSQPTPPNGKKITICVQGRQFIWRYTYGAQCANNAFNGKLPYSYQKMYAPMNTTVVLVIQSTDVIHSWWIPSLGGKVDATPGYTTYTWFKSPKKALFHGQCAQLCGRNHAAMTALVQVMDPADYQAKLKQLSSQISQQNAQVTQLRQILQASGNLVPSANP